MEWLILDTDLILYVNVSDYVLEGSEGTPFAGLANCDNCIFDILLFQSPCALLF